MRTRSSLVRLGLVVLVVAAALGATLAAGCNGKIVGPSANGPDAAPPSVAFTAPAAGAAFTRDGLSATGALVAHVPVTVATTGDVARVAITSGGAALGDVDGAGALTAELAAAGPATLTATAYDAGGAAVATATVDVTVTDATVADCHAALDLYHVTYTAGPAMPGVVDPVTVDVPINGITYRYDGASAPRETFFMDCRLARSLAEAAPIFAAHHVTEVQDIGVYNYRCIDNLGTPPNCTKGMSQHAYAMAIDFARFVQADGTIDDVAKDWVIDADPKSTCTATGLSGKNAFLHQLICEEKDAKVWNIVLTPNYDSYHATMFHVDLTPGADFIQQRVDGSGGPGVVIGE